jgi:hypothetical protein
MSRGVLPSVHYNLGNHKPLIDNQQTYVLDRKVLSVHSEDRDVTKWPESNTFEIVLPEAIHNVQSLRLVQCTFPNTLSFFLNSYQNTKLQVTIDGETYIVTIQEGSYTPAQMALELTTVLNAGAVDVGVDPSFNVFYDEVGHIFWFGHSSTSFTLDFDVQLTYDLSNCLQPIVWYQSINWGLPYNLGFSKEAYEAQFSASGIDFGYLCPTTSGATGTTIHYYVKAPCTFILTPDRAIYMEVDKYNTMDEMYPYNQSTKAIFNNNAYNGKVEAAFAKIPIVGTTGFSYDSRCLFLQNFAHYDPVIERIARLKFKFRYHDGRLVDFQCQPFDFAIEFNCLRPEIEKYTKVRIPETYQL